MLSKYIQHVKGGEEGKEKEEREKRKPGLETEKE